MLTRTHRAVTDDFFTTAPEIVRTSQELPVDAATAFRCLADAEPWKQWLGLDDVTWTSETGPAATRTIRNGPITAVEQFFAWDEAERMAFHFASSQLPVRAFAEDYRLVENDDGTCRLDWTIAIDARPRLLARAVGVGMRRMAATGLPRLSRLLEQHGERWAT